MTGAGNGATLVLASVLLLGTGSLTPSEITGAHVGTTIYPSRPSVPAEEEQVITSSVPALISTVRSIFGLNAAEMARVLSISRTTLYDWTSERQSPQTENQQRLRDLFELSRRWHAAVGTRVDTLQRQFADKSEILSVLTSTDLRSHVVFAKLDLIAQARRSAPRVKSFAQRMRERGVKRTDTLEREL